MTAIQIGALAVGGLALLCVAAGVLDFIRAAREADQLLRDLEDEELYQVQGPWTPKRRGDPLLPGRFGVSSSGNGEVRGGMDGR